MKKNNTITVYWSPASFTTQDKSWELLYPNPDSVFHEAVRQNTHGGKMTQCPAVKNFFKNTFSFKSAIDDEFIIPTEITKAIANTSDSNVSIPTTSKLQLTKVRKTSFKDFVNVEYNMGWLFFASEPVLAEFTAPFFPSASPVPGALLSAGSFDIGSWFRPYNLDYHLPIEETNFSIKEGDPLFYLRILTDKKVNMQRFMLTPKLSSLANEMGTSSIRYGAFKKLQERYAMFKNASAGQIILSEIKKNLI